MNGLKAVKISVIFIIQHADFVAALHCSRISISVFRLRIVQSGVTLYPEAVVIIVFALDIDGLIIAVIVQHRLTGFVTRFVRLIPVIGFTVVVHLFTVGHGVNNLYACLVLIFLKRVILFIGKSKKLIPDDVIGIVTILAEIGSEENILFFPDFDNVCHYLPSAFNAHSNTVLIRRHISLIDKRTVPETARCVSRNLRLHHRIVTVCISYVIA